MFEKPDDNIYPGQGGIYAGRLEKDLRRSLGEKTIDITRAGKDILAVLDRDQIREVLSVLKNNAGLSIDVLRNLRIIWEDNKSFLLCEMRASEYDQSIILKIGYSGQPAYRRLLEEIGGYYRVPAYTDPGGRAGGEAYDLKIPGSMLAGCSAIDLGLVLDKDAIDYISISTGPSKALRRDFFRGLEIDQLISYMGRFDHSAGIFPELAFCLGIEALLQLEVPRRAEYLRMIMSELFRITSHLDLLSRLAQILGNDMAANIIMTERENLLGLVELAAGARVIPNFIRIGGVSSRVGSDVLKKIKRRSAAFLKRFAGIERMIMNDFTLIERLSPSGVISRDQALSWGLSGPSLRASGPRHDLRKLPGYGTYRDIHFTMPYARGGSSLDRIGIRIKEIYQSVKIIMQAVDRIPSGAAIKRINLAHLDFKPGYFTSSVECPHGLLKIFAGVAENRLTAFTVMGPSGPALSAASELLKGNNVDDIEIMMASLDISGGELLDYV